MLHLQTGVHFHEEEIHAAVIALLNDEFNRACAYIVDRTRRRYRRFTHLLAHGLGHARRRCFFQYFLMPALHRAVAFKQINVAAVHIAKDLNFNVPGPLRVLFNQYRIVAKTVNGFAFARRQRGVKVF